MVNKKNKRAPAKSPRTKLPAKVPAAPKSEDDKTPEPVKVDAAAVAQVAPLAGDVFNLLMQIIDNTDFKGREINQVIAVKLELARVAGLRQGDGQ